MPILKSICSHSLGRAWSHSLQTKLDAAAAYGFTHLELFFEDLEYLADTYPGGRESPAALLAAAQAVRTMCDARSITIVCLQPFMHYDGLRDRAKHAERTDEMTDLWLRIAKVLGTDLIAVPSTFLPKEEVTGDLERVVGDLRELADLGAACGVRFAYEALAWGTHIDTWEMAWGVVHRVDRENFGLCLDTFNIAGRVFADPARDGGKVTDAEPKMRQSLRRLVETVDVSKIMFLQVADGEKLEIPIEKGHDFYEPDQPARMSWSRNCRLFYGEDDRAGYLPVKDILEATIIDLGYDGPVSFELFSRTTTGEKSSIPTDHAKRAAESWTKMVKDLGIDVKESTVKASRDDTDLPTATRSGAVIEQVGQTIETPV